jgi:hypothetical protein
MVQHARDRVAGVSDYVTTNEVQLVDERGSGRVRYAGRCN